MGKANTLKNKPMKYCLILLMLCFAAAPALAQVEEKIGEAEVELKDTTINIEDYQKMAYAKAQKNAIGKMADVIMSSAEKQEIGLGDYENEEIRTSFQSLGAGLVRVEEIIAEGIRKVGDREYYYFKARFSRDMSAFKGMIMEALQKMFEQRKQSGKISDRYTLEELLAEEFAEGDELEADMSEFYLNGLSTAGMDADIEMRTNGIEYYFKILDNTLSRGLVYGQVIPRSSKVESTNVKKKTVYDIRYDINWKWSHNKSIRKQISRFNQKIYNKKFRQAILSEIEKINSENRGYKLELDNKGKLSIVTREPTLTMQLLSNDGDRLIKSIDINHSFDDQGSKQTLNFLIKRSELGLESNYTLKITSKGFTKKSLVFTESSKVKKRQVYDKYKYLSALENQKFAIILEGVYTKNSSSNTSVGGLVSLGYRYNHHYLGAYAGLLPNPYTKTLKEAGGQFSFGLDYRYYLFKVMPESTRGYSLSEPEKRPNRFLGIDFYPFVALQLGQVRQSGGADMAYRGYTGELRLGLRIGERLHLSIGGAYTNLKRKGELKAGELRNPPVPVGVSGTMATIRFGYSL